MKYWEVNEIAIVDDWLGDEEWWTIKILNRTEKNAVDGFLFKINRLRGFLDEQILETRYEQELLAEMRWFDFTSVFTDEIFLWKIKKLKATPQGIWSAKSTRWYSTEIANAIIEWENVFKYYVSTHEHDHTQKKEETITGDPILPTHNPVPGIVLNKENWFLTINGKKKWWVSEETQPFYFLECLVSNPEVSVSHDDIIKYIKEKRGTISGKVSSESEKSSYCSNLKNDLPEKIKSFISGKNHKYKFTMVKTKRS